MLIVEDTDIINENNKHENTNNENNKFRNEQRGESLNSSSSDGSAEEGGSTEKIGSGEKDGFGEKIGSGEENGEESGLRPKLYGSILKHPGKVINKVAKMMNIKLDLWQVRRRGMIKHVEFLDKLVDQEAAQEMHTRDF